MYNYFLYLIYLIPLTLCETLAILSPGDTITISQDAEWTYAQLLLNPSSKTYIRISLEILHKPEDAEPVLALSSSFPYFDIPNSNLVAEYIDYNG